MTIDTGAEATLVARDVEKTYAGTGEPVVALRRVSLTLAATGLGCLTRNGNTRRHLLATDGRERFARVGRHFLGEALTADDVELVDL